MTSRGRQRPEGGTGGIDLGLERQREETLIFRIQLRELVKMTSNNGSHHLSLFCSSDKMDVPG